MNASDSILETIRQTREKFSSPLGQVKEILVGYELKCEIERVIKSPVGPFTDPLRCCGAPLMLRPEAFPVGAEVMGAIIYLDEKRFPTLIMRSRLTSPIRKKKK